MENINNVKAESNSDLENSKYYDNQKHLFMASAGSGKTFRLAFEYICLLLHPDYPVDNYKHILAITFTIKATGEMKSRILDNLQMVGSEPDLFSGKKREEKLDYEKHLCNRLGYNDVKKLRQRAKLVFASLLHDYSHFNIRTIDSFFQKVLRNMARELGIGSFWNVEMDQNSVLAEATQQLFDLIKNDQMLHNWIYAFVEGSMDDNSHWNVKGDIQKFATNLYKEEFSSNAVMREYLGVESGTPQDTRNKIGKLIDSVNKQISSLMTEVKKQQNEFKQISKDNNLTEDAFPYKYHIHILSNKDFCGTEQNIIDSTDVEVVSKCFKGEFVKKCKSVDLTIPAMKIRDVLKTMDGCKKEISRFRALTVHISELALLVDIMGITRDLLSQRNLFMIADTQPLLKRFTNESDAPFIFERIGEDVKHIMIDEFQDTSSVQFQNFEPLIKNCASNGGTCLLVGDPKQAIYRFRNGDWTLICTQRKNGEYQTHNMGINYRSDKNIVDFNNMIFADETNSSTSNPSVVMQAKQHLSELPIADPPSNFPNIIYEGGKQYADSVDEGFVSVRMHKKVGKNDGDSDSDNDDWMLEQILDCLKKIKCGNVEEGGVRTDDVTILVDKNKYIPGIASFLSSKGYKVVSGEAFQYKSSPKVRLIVDAIRYVDSLRSDDSVNKENSKLYRHIFCSDFCRYLVAANPSGSKDWVALLASDEVRLRTEDICREIENRQSQLPLYDLIEELCQLMFGNEPTDAFIQAFLDSVIDFFAHHNATTDKLIDYWDSSLSVKTIPVDESAQTGIRIMSVHKSKGLESHTIILPYCSWKNKNDSNSEVTLWCNSENQFADNDDVPPYLPVKYGEDLKKLMPDDYSKENAQQFIDSLNKLYVALTRPRKNLFVIGEYKTTKSDKKGEPEVIGNDSVSCLLIHALGSLLLTEEASGDFVYSVGKVAGSKAVTTDDSMIIRLNEHDIFPKIGRFRQSSLAKVFIENSDLEESEAQRIGNMFHKIMEKIECFNSLDDLTPEVRLAIDELALAGYIENPEEQTKMVVDTLNSLGTERLSEWFGSGLKTYNECSIVSFDFRENSVISKRPDRVVFNADSNTYTIIDYKTGEREAKHKEQVSRYASLIKNINPGANVRAYLWYTSLGKVESV